MDIRRFLLFIVLAVAIMAAWTYFFPPPKPAPKPPAAVPEAPSGTPQAAPSAAAPPLPEPAAGKPALPPWAGGPVQAAAEQRVVLEDERVRAEFTNRGAQLVSLQVKDPNGKGSSVELVRKRAAGNLHPYALVREGDLAPHPLNQSLFQVQRGRDGRSLIFRHRGPAGVAEKTFRFDDQGFLEVVVNVPGDKWALAVGPGLGDSGADQRSTYSRHGAVYRMAGDVEMLDAKGAEEPTVLAGRLDWIGLEDTYFLAAQIPRTRLDGAVLRPMMVEGSAPNVRFRPLPPEDRLSSDQKKLPREYLLALEPAGESLSLLSYWGDKNYDRLASLPYNLEGSVKLGMFAFVAKPLLVALHWIHDNVVANYGWAIILLTIVIKILLLPLTHTNMKSMKRMQELNPKVQQIRDKYRSKLKDKQGKPNLDVQRKMNDEVMAVYREAGVNPVGGCLPILLQMPILFAFFNLLTAAVELRGAPWMLWILDLSSKDPYYVLPIVMGATQWLQVRMAPQSGDPLQRRMFELMPIVMTVMFIGVPSGLVLYWLTNNVLTILQQAAYKRLEKRTA